MPIIQRRVVPDISTSWKVVIRHALFTTDVAIVIATVIIVIIVIVATTLTGLIEVRRLHSLLISHADSPGSHLCLLLLLLFALGRGHH